MKKILGTNIRANKKSNYALMALICSIVSICGFLYFSKMFEGTIIAYQSLEQPPIFSIRITQFLSLSSIVLLIISYSKREPRSWVKGIATLIVIVSLLIYGAAIAFYYYIESSK